MQNKANLPDIQMNVSYVKTTNYEQRTMDNEPIKQSQTKPNERREVPRLNKINCEEEDYEWECAELKSGQTHRPAPTGRIFKSGRQDLNLRPLAPHASALAKLRHAPIV